MNNVYIWFGFHSRQFDFQSTSKTFIQINTLVFTIKFVCKIRRMTTLTIMHTSSPWILFERIAYSNYIFSIVRRCYWHFKPIKKGRYMHQWKICKGNKTDVYSSCYQSISGIFIWKHGSVWLIHIHAECYVKTSIGKKNQASSDNNTVKKYTQISVHVNTIHNIICI